MSGLSQRTLDAIAEAVAQAVAAALVPTQAPAAPVATAQPVHVGPSGKPDGRRFPCTAERPCGRLLRSAKRAAIHGVEAGGHEAAK